MTVGLIKVELNVISAILIAAR